MENTDTQHFTLFPYSNMMQMQITHNYQAHALRALGLLLADGTPTVGGGKTY